MADLTILEEPDYIVGAGARIMETARADQDLQHSLHVIVIPKSDNADLLEEIYHFSVTAYLFRISDVPGGEMDFHGFYVTSHRYTESDEFNIVRFHFNRAPIIITNPGTYQFKVMISGRTVPPSTSMVFVSEIWSNEFTITPGRAPVRVPVQAPLQVNGGH